LFLGGFGGSAIGGRLRCEKGLIDRDRLECGRLLDCGACAAMPFVSILAL
jgi:hypothetical protein